MVDPKFEDEKQFLSRAKLECFIPQDSTKPISEILNSDTASSAIDESLLSLKERDLVFFDEKVKALAVLQIPQWDESSLQSCLARLELKIDAWVTDQSQSSPAPEGAHSSPARDIIFSQPVPHVEDPIILLGESDAGGSDERTLTLAWEVDVVFHRPRIRIPEPAVRLVAVAVVKSPRTNDLDGNFLTPFEPREPNVLEPMRHISGFEQNPPYLAASRLERVLPKPPASSHTFRIDHCIDKFYKIVPAAIARIRYTVIQSGSPKPKNIASLDIEIVPFVEVEATIEKAEVSMANGKAESLMSGFLPMDCSSRDHITFLYTLHAAVASPTSVGQHHLLITPLSNPNIDTLTISVEITVHLDSDVKARVSLDWTTNVDLSQALNPSFGPPSQPIQRTNRPTSLLGNGSKQASQSMTANLQPNLNANNHQGLTITFLAPSTPSRIGIPFTWRIIIVNRTTRPAKLTLIPLPRVQRATPSTQTLTISRRHAPKSSTASFHPSERRHTHYDSTADKEEDIAQAIVDENVVYAMQHNANNTPLLGTDLMALTAEVRIGPLGPGQCHESEIQMVAFVAGCLQVDAIRVVDLMREAEEGAGTVGVITDVRDLPDVLVVDD